MNQIYLLIENTRRRTKMKIEEVIAASELIKNYKELTDWDGCLVGYRPVIEWGDLRFEITQEEADILLKNRIAVLAETLRSKGVEV
jgi:hypothetical protein